MLQASLRVVGGKHDGELIPMATHRFLIGREEDCHLRPNNDMVSRHHCAFTIDDYSVRLRDLGSTNGTLVNGTRLRGETNLKVGDQVAIGKLVFELQIAAEEAVGAAAAAETSELQTETAELSSDETSYEIPTVPAEEETRVLQAEEVAAATPAAPEAAAAPAAAPAQQPMMQPPMGYYPQQQMGYPPQPMGYPQPGYYMPQPMGYPQPPGYFPQYGYPPQMMPGQPVPAQVQPPPEPQETAPESEAADEPPAVRLPDPSETGAVDAPKKTSDGAAPTAEDNPSNNAADIIRQHMNRRPSLDE